MEDRITALEQTSQEHGMRLQSLEHEEQRTRRRLHELEGDRAALRHLTKVAGEVFEAAKQMQEHAAELVEEAAVKAVEKAFKVRSELRWKYMLRVATVIGGFGAFAYVFVALFK